MHQEDLVVRTDRVDKPVRAKLGDKPARVEAQKAGGNAGTGAAGAGQVGGGGFKKPDVVWIMRA